MGQTRQSAELSVLGNEYALTAFRRPPAPPARSAFLGRDGHQRHASLARLVARDGLVARQRLHALLPRHRQNLGRFSPAPVELGPLQLLDRHLAHHHPQVRRVPLLLPRAPLAL
eukprot:2818150-Prymnesium_polylepis.1